MLNPRTEPMVQPVDDSSDMELNEEDVEELAGESTLAEVPVPVELQAREVYRLADDSAHPDEPSQLGMRKLEENELLPPSIEDDDGKEVAAADENLDVRVRKERQRHKNRRRTR
jgi:hypothetical protein